MTTEQQKQRALADLAKADEAVRDREEQRVLCVQIARDRGATWAEIGEVLGVTRQAAQMRFGR